MMDANVMGPGGDSLYLGPLCLVIFVVIGVWYVRSKRTSNTGGTHPMNTTGDGLFEPKDVLGMPIEMHVGNEPNPNPGISNPRMTWGFVALILVLIVALLAMILVSPEHVDSNRLTPYDGAVLNEEHR